VKDKQTMKHRDQTTPLLSPEAYIALWKAASQPTKVKHSRVSRNLWRQLTAKLLMTAKLLLLAACSPNQEPRVIEPIDPMSLVWVQPEGRKEPRAKTLPIVGGNPYQL